VLENSEYFAENKEQSHQWLDENGWEIRKAYVELNDGKIYPVLLSIGRTRDGRNILYAISIKTKEGIDVDMKATSEYAKQQTRQAVKTTKPSDDVRIAQNGGNVNKRFSSRETESVC